MTKEEAVEGICGLSCGTLAILTGLKKYDQIDAYCRKVAGILMDGKVDVTDCKNWVAVWWALEDYENV